MDNASTRSAPTPSNPLDTRNLPPILETRSEDDPYSGQFSLDQVTRESARNNQEAMDYFGRLRTSVEKAGGWFSNMANLTQIKRREAS